MILLKNGQVISPADKLNGVYDILIDNGVIAEINKKITSKAEEVLDLKGKLVFPGFIDMHVHLREPGYEEKETIKSGSRAAASGGFTQIAAMPNTNPLADEASVIKYVKDTGERIGLVEVHPIGAVTRGCEGEFITQMGEMTRAGAVAFSDDGRPVMNAQVMRKALEYASLFKKRIISHTEDINLSNKGAMNEGTIATTIGLPGIPNAAEEVQVAREIILAKYFGQVHIAHLSTPFGAELVKLAKKKGIDITCEVTPHHLILNDALAENYDSNTRVSPPLRSETDRQALLKYLQDGTIDMIATDHAPHTYDDKNVEYIYAANGISGIETAAAIVYSKLVLPGIISLERMAELMSVNPAKIFGLDGGSLKKGSKANITVLDPKESKKVLPDNFKSKGRNTPLKGWELQGWPFITIVRGRVVYQNGRTCK